MADAPAPKLVDVVGQGGDMHSVPEPQLGDWLRSGAYRHATPEETAAYWRHEDYGGVGSAAGAFGEGALNALTFGAGTAGLRALGVTTKEGEEARAAEHPIAHGAGTVTGLLAPVALTAGAAAPLEGAEAASGAVGAARAAAELTAPALIARVGRGAAALAEGAGLPGVLGRIAPSLAAGATEGALWSSSDVTEKALLGDPQLTWEKAASEVGLGGLFGGALGAGMPAAAKGLGWMMQKATAGLESIGARLAKGDPEVMQLMLKQKGTIQALETAAPGAADAISAATPETARFIIRHSDRISRLEGEFPGLTDILSRATPDTAGQILDNWGKLLKDPQARIDVGNSMSQAVSSAYSAIEDGLQLANREVRPAETKFLLDPATGGLTGAAPPEAAQAEGSRVLGEVEQLAASMRSKLDLYPAMYPAKLELIRDGLTREIQAGDPASIFTALNDAKQQMDPLAKFGKLTGPEHRDATSAIKDLRGVVKSSLEDSKLWGPAADRQAAFNAAQNQYFTARTKLQKLLMQQQALPTGRVTFEAAPTKINSWINLMADGRGEAKSQVFGEYLSAAQNLAREMEVTGVPDAPQISQHLREVLERTKEIQQRGTITQLVKMLQGHEILSSGPAIPAGHAMALKAARYIPGGVGHIIGLTSDIAGTIQKVRQPSAMVGVLSALEKLAKKSSGKLEQAAQGIFSSGVGGAAAGEMASSGAERFAHGGVVGSGNFADVSTHIRHLAGNLDGLAESVSRETSGLQQHAPATADAARAFAARVVGYLAPKLPDGGQRQLLDAPFEPSAAELQEYNRHHDVASRGPLAVLEHLARGTLHPDHLAASQTLYPKLHAEAQQLVAEKLAEHVADKRHVPLAIRPGLGMLLGQDLDHASTPQAILAAQQSYASPPPAPATPAGGKPREVQVKSASRLATGSQKNTMALGGGTTRGA